jgi:NAD(P)-dependent dehydrogenase (short-subunit alcohol dehydrogenase family)
MNIRRLGALITGGSRGLGLALGRELGAAGARVVLVARRGTELQRGVDEIRAAGAEAYGIVADVSELGAAHAIAAQAAELLGAVELLVNNASTLGHVPLRLLLDTDCEELERTLAVNLVGPFRLTKAVLGSMLLRGSGTIVNVSSDAAVEPYRQWGVYAASKAALEQLTRVWAVELADSGVRMFSVDPGEMNTRMHADAVPDADPATLRDPSAVARALLHTIEDARVAPAGARIVLPELEALP